MGRLLLFVAVMVLLFSNQALVAQSPKAKYQNAEEAYRAGLAFLAAKDLANTQIAFEEALRLAGDDTFRLRVYRAATPVYRALPEIYKTVEAMEFIVAKADSAAESSLARTDLLSFVYQRG